MNGSRRFWIVVVAVLLVTGVGLFVSGMGAGLFSGDFGCGFGGGFKNGCVPVVPKDLPKVQSVRDATKLPKIVNCMAAVGGAAANPQ